MGSQELILSYQNNTKGQTNQNVWTKENYAFQKTRKGGCFVGHNSWLSCKKE